MKLQTLCVLTHVAAATAGAGVVFALQGTSVSQLAITAAAVIASCGFAGWSLASRTGRALLHLEQVVSSGATASRAGAGIDEFDEAAQRLGEYAQRWREASSAGSEQSRELTALAAQLERRGANPADSRRRVTAQQLRQMLTGIGSAVDAELLQTADFVRQIERRAEQLVGASGEQEEAVGKVTTYVEQISATTDRAFQHGEKAHQTAAVLRESAESAHEAVQGLTRRVEQVRAMLDHSETKLRTLGDRAREVGGLVAAIGDICSRTDLLALNAAIESVRAGEHGRGFAVVAEEVRKLAEQTAGAVHEISLLVESSTLEAQESVAVTVEHRLKVDEELSRLLSTAAGIQRIVEASGQSANQASEVGKMARQQLQLVQHLVAGLQSLSQSGKACRGHADGLRWDAKSLSDTVRQLDGTLVPLRAADAGQRRVLGDAPDAARRGTEGASNKMPTPFPLLETEPDLSAPVAASMGGSV